MRERFFYTASAADVKYKRTPTSELDVSRLLKGKPYWKDCVSGSKKKKKTLIITRERLNRISKYSRRTVAERLMALKKEGFKIYVAHQEGLTELVAHNVKKYFKDKDVIPPDSKPITDKVVVNNAMQTLNLSRDEVLMIDDVLFEELAFVDYGDDDWVGREAYKEVDLENSPINVDAFERFIQQEGLNIESLNLLNCCGLEEYKGSIIKIKGYLTNLKKLVAGSSGDNYFGKSNKYGRLNPLYFFMIIVAAENLKSLSLFGEDGGFFNKISSRAPTLEELNLSDVDLNEGRTIFSKFENLKSLSIENCKFEGYDFDNAKIPLLEELKISSQQVTGIQVKNILRYTRSLKSLSLINCWDLNVIKRVFEEIDFSLLEKLNLSGSAIDAETMVTILSKIPNIKSLNLCACQAIKDSEMLFSGFDFSIFKNLEELDLNATKIDDKTLNKILENAPNLKKISLLACDKLTDNTLDNIRKNQKLESCEISGSLLSVRNYLAFCENEASVKSVCLEVPRHSVATESDFNYHLESIQVLILITEDSGKDFKIFRKLLENASNIRLLELNCDFSTSEPGDFNFNFNRLENLSLGGHITNAQLSAFLSRTPNIKELNLGSIILLDELQVDTLLQLKNLEKINISGSKIDPAVIENMITISKKPIKLDGVSSLYAKRIKRLNRFQSNSASLTNNSMGNENVSRLFFSGQYQYLDADTALEPNKKFNVTKVFYSRNVNKEIPVSSYRLSLYNDISINTEPCDARNACLMKNKSEDLDLVKRAIEKSEHDLYQQFKSSPGDSEHIFYGKQDLTLTTDWQPLASLSPNEIIAKYHLNPPADVEIQYSNRDSQYYIRLNPLNPNHKKDTMVNTKIDFIIEVPQEKLKFLPQEIQGIVNYCLSFRAGALKLPEGILTGQNYLDALQEQKVGACRHRSLVFMAMMKKQFPQIPVRIVNNECHSFAEVRYNNQWITCQLGGYPAELEIKEPNHPTEEMLRPTVSHLTESGSSVVVSPGINRHFPIPKKAEPEHVETKIFMEHILSDSENGKQIRNTRINIPGSSIPGFRYHLQDYCERTSKPYYYIDSAEDLVCMASYLKRNLEDNTGVIEGGETKEGNVEPAGPLFEFIKEHENDKRIPILIVNYDKFSSSEIVGFNALLDKHEADGVPLPSAAKVIGLFDPNKPNAYEGEDFSSRFQRRLDCPLLIEQLATPSIMQKPIVGEEQHVIELYGGRDWEERMLGRWIMQGEDLFFIEGELLKILNNKEKSIKNIELKNAPWHNPNFVRFWHDAQRKGQFSFEGKDYDLPMGLMLSASQGYVFPNLNLKINESEHVLEDAIVVNPGTLFKLFGEYQCDSKNKTIQYGDGVLQKLAEQKIKNQQENKVNLYITDNLDISVWAQIVDTCRDLHLAVELTLAPGVTLPNEFGIVVSEKKPVEPKDWHASEKSQLALAPTILIHTNDADVTLSQISSHIVIDVSEIDPAVLLGTIDGEFNKMSKRFSFTEKTGALLTGLEQGTVVLKGRFSDDIRYALAEFLFHRQHENKPKGQLILINDKPHLFPLATSYTHTVSEVEKENILSQEAMYKDFVLRGHNTTQFKTRPLVEQRAILRSFNVHPNDPKFDPDACWQGLESLPRITIPSEIDLRNAADDTKNFNDARKHAVEAVLNHSPFVFLAGMTGVGKTTFVQKVWKEKGPLHEGISNIKAWAADRSPGIKTLFIDEANISSRYWTEFEGLFNNPPGILIGTEYIELTPEHKVIFAGNPLSYGGERQIPALFKRHGNSVVFEPMTPAYIYHEVLEPILDSSGFKPDAEAIAKPILEVARFLTRCSQNEVLITARELGMMALLTATYCKNNPDANPNTVAKYYAYQLSHQFVPKANKNEFESKFKFDSLQRELNTHPGFLNTKSNEVAFNAVSDFIALRELRLAGKIPQGSGLGGLILEGEPGIGKTSLVFKTLVANGLEKGNPAVDNGGKPIFYDMPMSMSISAKEALLRKAFDEGAVVVIDEINSGAMLEGLLNALLMGKTPEGQLPTHPGFMIMGTQNPVTKAGRFRATKALEHRMQKVVIPEYTRPEMNDILIHKGLKEEVVTEILDDYQNRRLAESRDPSIPSVCFRDVITLADELLEVEKRKENIELELPSKPAILTAYDNLRRSKEDNTDNHAKPRSPLRPNQG